jgi:hypothetical protein
MFKTMLMYIEFAVALLVPMLSEFSCWCTLHLFTKLDGLILVLVHTACMVQTILPIIPTDPMDQHHVVKI